MKEIKFRAWLPYEKRMLVIAALALEESGAPHSVTASDESSVYFRGANFALMQYTGLKSNGQEWYDGDILESDADWYQIEWSNEDGRWEAVGIRSTGESLALCELISSETWVQGNIYENPELLK